MTASDSTAPPTGALDPVLDEDGKAPNIPAVIVLTHEAVTAALTAYDRAHAEHADAGPKFAHQQGIQAAADAAGAFLVAQAWDEARRRAGDAEKRAEDRIVAALNNALQLGADTEKTAVVAWLRAFTTNTQGAAFGVMALADAIERGDHRG